MLGVTGGGTMLLTSRVLLLIELAGVSTRRQLFSGIGVCGGAVGLKGAADAERQLPRRIGAEVCCRGRSEGVCVCCNVGIKGTTLGVDNGCELVSAGCELVD